MRRSLAGCGEVSGLALPDFRGRAGTGGMDGSYWQALRLQDRPTGTETDHATPPSQSGGGQCQPGLNRGSSEVSRRRPCASARQERNKDPTVRTSTQLLTSSRADQPGWSGQELSGLSPAPRDRPVAARNDTEPGLKPLFPGFLSAGQGRGHATMALMNGILSRFLIVFIIQHPALIGPHNPLPVKPGSAGGVPAL